AGARLDVRGRRDGHGTAPAVQRDVALYLGGDQHDGGLDAQNGFLDRVRRDRDGSTEPGTREEEPEHQRSHGLATYHGARAAYNDARAVERRALHAAPVRGHAARGRPRRPRRAEPRALCSPRRRDGCKPAARGAPGRRRSVAPRPPPPAPCPGGPRPRPPPPPPPPPPSPPPPPPPPPPP